MIQPRAILESECIPVPKSEAPGDLKYALDR